jgi:ferrochelatase
MNLDKPTGLVLLNMGGPDSLRAVRPFLYNLFSDRDLIQLPAGALLQKPFAFMISTLRAPKVKVNYASIGGKSPLLEWTEKQAAGVARELGGVPAAHETGGHHAGCRALHVPALYQRHHR